jgi:hypothetical protein
MHKIQYLGYVTTASQHLSVTTNLPWVFSFDMDYTLCEYNSPATEELTYTLIVDQLLAVACCPPCACDPTNALHACMHRWATARSSASFATGLTFPFADSSLTVRTATSLRYLHM